MYSQGDIIKFIDPTNDWNWFDRLFKKKPELYINVFHNQGEIKYSHLAQNGDTFEVVDFFQGHMLVKPFMLNIPCGPNEYYLITLSSVYFHFDIHWNKVLIILSNSEIVKLKRKNRKEKINKIFAKNIN